MKDMNKQRGWLALVIVGLAGCAGEPTQPSAKAPAPSLTNPEPAQPSAKAPAVNLTNPSPFLFAQEVPNSREWAKAANYYISLGEAAGLARLKADATKFENPWSTRAAHLCRVLFEGKDGRPLREPALGGLALPYDTMPLSAWPEFPMVVQDGVWFIMAEGYTLAGYPEPYDQYIAYCQANGRYRKLPVKLPTATEAKAAVEALLGSKRWKAIRWSYKNEGNEYTYPPNHVISLLREQAEF